MLAAPFHSQRTPSAGQPVQHLKPESGATSHSAVSDGDPEPVDEASIPGHVAMALVVEAVECLHLPTSRDVGLYNV